MMEPAMPTDVVARKHRVLLCCLSALLLAAAPRGPAHRVKDINMVPGSGPDPTVSAIVAGNSLYFTVSGALWKSDGTAAGTQPVEGTGAILGVQFKAVLGDILYFTASDGGHGVELWQTDGTLEGTRMVRDIKPGRGGSGIQSLVAFRGELYFGANDGVHGFELWKTDGTKDGTVLVTDLNPGSNGSALFSLRAGGDGLYFSESSLVCGKPAALYTTDGTASGTRLLRQFVTQGTSSIGFETCFGWPPGDFRSFGGLTYFIASDGVSGLQLWRTDGTTLGTALVKDICSGRCSSFSFSDGVLDMGTPLLQVINGRLFFFANDGVHGREPWTSDGTEAGTRLVKDGFPGSAGSADLTWGYGLTVVGAAVVFPAGAPGGWEMWRSDGTEAGTFPVGAFGSQGPIPIVPVGDMVFFTAAPGSGNRRLWKTDSAGAQASVVSDSILDPTALVNFGGTLYFMAPGPAGFSLWKTDGSPAGTQVVRVVGRESVSSNPPAHWRARRVAPLLRERREWHLSALEERWDGRRHASDRSADSRQRLARRDGQVLRSISRIALLQRQ